MILPVLSGKKAADRLKAILARGASPDAAVEAKVREILADVKSRGLTAAVEYARQFDGLGARQGLRIGVKALDTAAAKCPRPVQEAIRRSIRQVRAFHERQIEESWVMEGPSGQWLGMRVAALRRVGLYVPGGAGAYPSSVVMNVVPARVAGVSEIAVVTPCSRGLDPAVAYALRELAVDEVYAIGGAQAVGLLAYGAKGIPAVDKIVGPCNVWASVAKREVFGTVAIDNIAGPSEILCFFDRSVHPDWVAADLLSQAEHGSGWEAAIGLTVDPEAAQSVSEAVQRQVESSPRKAELELALSRNGLLRVCTTWSEALEIANRIAPEHAEIMAENVQELLEGLRNAGAIFVGPWTSEPVGDYMAGPNHVLPTSGTARFASPLGVHDFIKRTSLLLYGPQAIAADGPHIANLADAEGFHHHAEAIRLRIPAAKAALAPAPKAPARRPAPSRRPTATKPARRPKR
ncbi:MAG: histidinol dehydrogenase [Fibrobacteria bacterium]|nr:histidinol dehydrogenase [Fibrobacteria bacterium]